MSVIRMETENVRAAAHKVDLAAGDLYMKPSKLRSIASSLTGVWDGGHASAYAAELRKYAQILQKEVINLQGLAQRLRAEVNEWEEKSRTFGSGSLVEGISIWDSSKGLRDFIGNYKEGIDLGASLGVIGGAVAGTSYAGQVVFSGGHSLKRSCWPCSPSNTYQSCKFTRSLG